MSEHSSSNGSSRSRRGGRNRRKGGRPRSRVPRAKVKQPSAFSKFLSVISFGLLGQAKSKKPARKKPASAPSQSQRQGERRKREKPRRELKSASPEEVNTERLYVGNLSYDATESDLFELFNGVGGVRNAEVVVNSRTQRSKGFAFVTMASIDEARRAVEVLGGQDFMGRPLQLSGAKPVSRRREAEPANDAAEEAEPEAEAEAKEAPALEA
jgi:RNA recognition motif-containing protein